MQCIISEKNNLWASCFDSKYSKFYVDSGNAGENGEDVFRLGDNCIWIGCVKHLLVIGCQYVNKQYQNFKYYWNRVFKANFFSGWSKKRTKILSFRFTQCFGPFNVLTVHKCSVTVLSGYLSNPAFSNR